MNTKKLKLALIGLMLHVISIGFAGQSIETNDFGVVAQKAYELAEHYGMDEVLIVYDIDNTLLAMNQDLGSDQWFNWQAAKIASGDLIDVVAKDFPALLSVQGMLYAVSGMHAPDPEAPSIVNELQQEGFYDLVLTSRGFDYRDSTLRELSKNGYHFTASTLDPQEGFAGTYLPYELSNISDYGLSEDEIKKFKLGEARPVSFMDGIFMTAGQHKGALLRTLLWKTDHLFKAILFIDDQKKHCDRMHEAFDVQGVDVVSIRYSMEDDHVREFEQSDKSQVVEAWESLKNILLTIFSAEYQNADAKNTDVNDDSDYDSNDGCFEC